jgi:hypothetical protein
MWNFGAPNLWVQGSEMTLELALINVLAGIALGLRYKVVILVPAVALAMTFAMIVGIARADHVGSIVLTMAILGSGVQLGYLTGIAIYAVAGPICASLIGGRNPALNSEIGRT